MDGMILYQGKSDGTTFTIPYLCTKGNLYILKVGTETIKYLFSPTSLP